MGAASKVISVALRFGELACSVVVLGLLGRFLWLIDDANAYADSRVVYSTVIASISLFLSIVLVLPFTYSFLAFPADFIMFVLWLVAFCLMETLTGIHTCDSLWYWSYWGFYWGGFWRTPIIVDGPLDIDWAGCASWKAILACSFIVAMAFLVSSILGAYVIMKYREENRRPYGVRNIAYNINPVHGMKEAHRETPGDSQMRNGEPSGYNGVTNNVPPLHPNIPP